MSTPTNAVAVREPSSTAVATAPQPGAFSAEQMDIIKSQVAVGVSDGELGLFVEVCKSTGLNPFQRQIYAIVREAWDASQGRRVPRMTIQTGIDGYRLIAARTAQHAGTTDPEFGPLVGGHPEWARVTVSRWVPIMGRSAEFTATARWAEYVQATKDGKPSGMWAKMPHTMLGKCAEALALRKAFPAELSGVYTAEEMSQADSGSPAVVAPAPPASTPERSTDEYQGDLKTLEDTLGQATREEFIAFWAAKKEEMRRDWPERWQIEAVKVYERVVEQRRKATVKAARQPVDMDDPLETGDAEIVEAEPVQSGRAPDADPKAGKWAPGQRPVQKAVIADPNDVPF